MTRNSRDEVISNQGPMGYCDNNPNTPHRVIIVRTDGFFNKEKSCKNWRLSNRMI
jgi:hypothetical protein